MSGYGLLCQGIHQAVQGTALGVAVTIGIGGTGSAGVPGPAIFPPYTRYGPIASYPSNRAFDVPLDVVLPAVAARRTRKHAFPPTSSTRPLIDKADAVGPPLVLDEMAGTEPPYVGMLAPVLADAPALPGGAPDYAPSASALPLLADTLVPAADASPFLDAAPLSDPAAHALPSTAQIFGGEAAAAPWLGDPGPKRQAAIALADMGSRHAFAPAAALNGQAPHAAGEPMSTAPDRDDDDPASGVPSRDMDVAADSTATDGAAREGDLLSLQTLSRGGLALSGGYSSIEGPIASIKLSRTNIGAPGRDISVSARYSKVQTLVELGAVDGNLLGSKFAVAPTFFYSRSTAVGFDKADSASLFVQSARGINFYVGRQLDRGFRVAANYRFSDEDFRIRRKNALCDVGIHGTLFCDALGPSTSSVFSVALSLDRRDSATDPTRGFQLRVTQDIAGPGGTTRYVRIRAGGTFHRRLSGNLDVSLGLEGGYMKGFGGRDIPLFDRFYIGGNSMRGFDLRGLGPKVIPVNAGPGQATAIGGSAYYVGRLELSMRLDGALDKFGVTPSIFVDAGSVFGTRRSELGPGEVLIGNSAKPRVAVGFGLSFNLAPGKLRFNIAQPVVRQAGDRSKAFSITFGTAF